MVTPLLCLFMATMFHLDILENFHNRKIFGELPEYSNLPPSDQVQRPYLHYDNKAIGQLATNTLLEQAKEDDNIYVKHIYDEVDLKVNGHKALGWFPHVEYYLNLAASGKLNYDDPFTDWDKYHRIIGVTWSGSVDPSMVFSERKCMQRSRARARKGIDRVYLMKALKLILLLIH